MWFCLWIKNLVFLILQMLTAGREKATVHRASLPGSLMLPGNPTRGLNLFFTECCPDVGEHTTEQVCIRWLAPLDLCCLQQNVWFVIWALGRNRFWFDRKYQPPEAHNTLLCIETALQSCWLTSEAITMRHTSFAAVVLRVHPSFSVRFNLWPLLLFADSICLCLLSWVLKVFHSLQQALHTSTDCAWFRPTSPVLSR